MEQICGRLAFSHIKHLLDTSAGVDWRTSGINMQWLCAGNALLCLEK